MSFVRTFVLTGLAMIASLSGRCHAEELSVLFLGDDGHHQPKPRFAELQPALSARGIQMTYTDNVADLNATKLEQYDALVLYANIDKIDQVHADALLKYVADGGGFVPLHCATYCFRNVPELVELMGAQFLRHGTGVFRTQAAEAKHDVMQGFGGFESWDETYVHHLHNEKHRTVLEYRVDSEGREPWTWVRTHGDGRVFYTAWGHDGRTWLNPGFQNLVERGIRWAAGKNPQDAGPYLLDQPFPTPSMEPLSADLKPFSYVDVGSKIPNYTPSKKWGVQGKPLNMMQEPVEPKESLKHIVVPTGFHVELFASEPDLKGKPICMTWDQRGRLWIAETVDYPNELRPEQGRDRIRICEDTTGDGKADQFTVFAEGLSIPTSIAFSNGGVIVQNAVETLYLKDTNGDDRADLREVIVTGWELGDTHGGVSNFQYGLDNWIWGMQGYNNSQPVTNDEKPQQRFRMGFFRMRPDGSEIEFVRSTNNNTWGLGISEDGLIFGSTANGNPSIYMPIANRYYEQVRGWTPSLTLSSIADKNDFAPITDKVRQVDHHGGYTAAAGHALYTAREYPQEYWNRVAFVCGPTGHLVGSFVLKQHGSDFSSTSPFNLFASDDEWTAPIMAEVGPDGQVWVIDWYNYIVQHNPTPEGFKTGKGRAYETDLRDKKYGRIYRVVPDGSAVKPAPNLDQKTGSELVATLSHPTMLVRKHAQRLLVERGQTDVVDQLVELVQDQSVDPIGLNPGAIHALWTLQGLGVLNGSNEKLNEVVYAALRHPSAGVRRNAIQVLPNVADSVSALENANSHQDRNAQVRLAAILALADLPATDTGGKLLIATLSDAGAMADDWIADATTSATANHSSLVLRSLTGLSQPLPRVTEIVNRVANHHARSNASNDVAELLANLGSVDRRLQEAVAIGFAEGFNNKVKVRLTAETEAKLEELLGTTSPSARGTIVKLATRWGSQRLKKYSQEIADALLDVVENENAIDGDRLKSANQLIEFLSDDADAVADVLDQVNPRTSPELAAGLLLAVGNSSSAAVGAEIVDRFASMTPSLKRLAIVQLLKRPASTMALLKGIEQGRATLSDLALDQKQLLASHSDPMIKELATKLLKQGGSLPSADRQKVMNEFAFVALEQGDPTKGKLAFKTHCSKCHVHSGEGVNVGPDLTGMAVHPKAELLTHILDPSRNVEGNFRAYSVLTVDGIVLNGMLASESKTAIELFNAEGKKISILRDDIDQFVMSTKSIMPEGFEKSMKPNELIDLLEFLTQRGQFLPLDLSKVATMPSDRGMFEDVNAEWERLVFPDWTPKTFAGIPFHVTDPREGSTPNAIVLHGPIGKISRKLPKSVSLPFSGSAKAIHLLSGVAGWGHPYGAANAVVLTVQIRYADGKTEDHELRNGIHFADYIKRVDVAESQFAFDLRGKQIRYLAINPARNTAIASLNFLKGPGDSAPVVLAVTVESASSKH